MVSALALLAAGQATPASVRDAYGVPHIRAASVEQAFYHAGYAVAQDRLWQMENSRRLARGRMAEIYGRQFLASDQEILRTGYTNEELQAQFNRMSPRTRGMTIAYVRGVNAWISEAKRKGLPEGYAQLGFQPEPWTVLDSAAVGVALLQRFGRGGAGEIRNMALLGYINAQPGAKGRELDVLDDFAFFNDLASPTTVRPEDDPLARSHPTFALPGRATTQRHAALLPKATLFELLPAIRMVSREASALVAERVAVPYKTGSYAIVVGPRRSATGRPLLLSGPQMGFRTPSVVHEMSIQAPGFAVVGMDVPGVPGIVIGHTRDHAWGLTSGVADTDDIFFYPADGADGYRYGDEPRKLQIIRRTLRVKGEPDQTVEAQRTVDGPVVLRSASSGTIFAKRASYWGAEMRSFDAVASLGWARDAAAIERALRGATMSFNFFYATRKGDIGYLYTGRVPIRATGLDPRLPTPGGSRFAWRGFIPAEKMPRVRNPKGGLIANWNNKPAAWWPNGDTPVWGSIFRVSLLLDELAKPRLTAADLENAVRTIARRDPTWAAFAPYTKTLSSVSGTPQAHSILSAYAGEDGQGEASPLVYKAFLDALREVVFVETTGSFVSPDNFRLIAQPSVLLRALQGKTKVDYLRGRSPEAVAQTAFGKAVHALSARLGAEPSAWKYAPATIAVPGGQPIPYSDRGTYIQIIQIGAKIAGRSVLPSGVAETGPHSIDQAPLAREWRYKPMGSL